MNKQFNKRTWTMNPEQLRMVTQFMIMRVEWDDIDMIASVDSTGIPFGITMSLSLGRSHVILPTQFHELKDLVDILETEHEDPPQLLIIDEYSANGDSIDLVADSIIDAGACVKHAVVGIDYEHGAVEQLARRGIELKSVLKLSDFGGD